MEIPGENIQTYASRLKKLDIMNAFNEGLLMRFFAWLRSLCLDIVGQKGPFQP